MNVKLIHKYEPKVYISNDAYNKTMEYINQSSQEIGWLATAERVDKDFYIEDTFLFKQEVSCVTTEIKEDGLNEFAMELMQHENGVEIWNKMRVWGHSHVNMGTNPSGQDNDQMKLFLENPNDFFIRIIGNKKEEFKIDIWDFQKGLIYENAEFTIIYDEKTQETIEAINKQISLLRERMESLISPNKELQEDIKNEIKEKVKEKRFTNVYGKGINTYGNTYGNAWDNYGLDDLYDEYGVYEYESYKDSKEDKKGKKNKKKVNIDEIFEQLEQEEIFLIMEGIEQGYSSSDMLNWKEFAYLTTKDFEELDDMVCDYTMKNEAEYTKYLISMEEIEI